MDGGQVIRVGLYLLIALCLPVLADTGLDALRMSLIGMRRNPPIPEPTRGATPRVTVAKHHLRDWVESRLKDFARRGDEAQLAKKLNAELDEAKLVCCQPTDRDWTWLGFLDHLKLERSSGFLILRTAIGILCGLDESAYLYCWSDEGWRRVWQTEQNTYTEKAYQPQAIDYVLISPPSKANDYVALTLGKETWCASNWHKVYYRAYRLGPDPRALLIEGAEEAYLGDGPPIQGSVTRGDVLVEFTVRSIDGGVHNRSAVRHYRIEGDTAKRVDPLALSPCDFVDEWLTHGWKEAVFWSQSANRRSMRDWHNRLHKGLVSGEFIYPTMHCPTTPDLWQVGIDFSDPLTPIGVEPKGTYFLVRWRPPYQFSMVEVRDRPFQACTEKDLKADEDRTLFPDQGTR